MLTLLVGWGLICLSLYALGNLFMDVKDLITAIRARISIYLVRAAGGCAIVHRVAKCRDGLGHVFVRNLLPAIVGVLIWIYRFKSEDALIHNAGGLLGWVFVAWTTLLVPNGLHCFTAWSLSCRCTSLAKRCRSVTLPPKPPTPEKKKEKPTDSVLPLRYGRLFGLFLGAGTALASGQAGRRGCCKLNKPVFPARESR